MPKIVFFDLDGTLLEGMSSENAFFCYLMKKRKIGLKQFFCACKFILRYFFRYHLRVFIKNKSYLAGFREEEMKELAKTFVHSKLLGKIRPRIKSLVEEHRKAGDKLVLLTGSPEFIAEHFFQALDMDELCSTMCIIKEGCFTEEPPRVHPFCEEKLEIAEKLCQQNHVDMQESVAYGNSFNDRFLLEGVGHPVAVTPDKLLSHIAKNRGWEIIH